MPTSGSIPLSQWFIFGAPNELDEFVKTEFDVVGVVSGDDELIMCDRVGGANCSPSEFGLWIGLLLLLLAASSALFRIGAMDVGQGRSSQSTFFDGNLVLGNGTGTAPFLDGSGGFCKEQIFYLFF